MYMMVLQNSVKFFGDTVFNIDPDAETLADITMQMADAVQGFGVTPRDRDDLVLELRLGAPPRASRKIQHALEIVRRRRPDLEIDGEMQPEMALDPERRQQYYGFSRLTRAANTLVFRSLAAGNAAYQIAEGRSAAPRRSDRSCSGSSKPVAALQNEAIVEDIVNMTAYVVLKAQQMSAREALRA